MKNDYPELNFDMENLLQNKKYEELTPEELSEMSDFISSKEDYTLMQNTFLSVKTSFGEEEEIIPSSDSKESLMKAFEAKHGKVVSITRRPFYLNPFFQVAAAAVLILGIVFFYPKGNSNDSMTAMNETADENGKESAPTEDKEELESPAPETSEESSEDVITDKSILEEKEIKSSEEKVHDTKPGYVFGETETVTTKSIVANDGKLNQQEGLAKKELVSDAKRDRAEESKKEKGAENSPAKNLDEVAFSKDEDASTIGGVSYNVSPTVATSGSADYKVSKESSKKSVAESDKSKSKEKDDKNLRTNSIGGHYYQPASVVDLKVGVPLSEKPDLASFLFTAL